MHQITTHSTSSWIMTQNWNDILFMHLPVSKEAIRNLIPGELELDTYHGQAYISIVILRITNTRFRKTPPIPFLHALSQVNIRTYVRRHGKAGIYFFRFDANSLPIVLGAKLLTLPYMYRKISFKKKRTTVEFNLARKETPLYGLKMNYRPISAAYLPIKGSLNYWLLERYYSWFFINKRLYESPIHHTRWKLQDTEVYINHESILPKALKETIKGSPFFTYSNYKQAFLLPLKKEQ